LRLELVQEIAHKAVALNLTAQEKTVHGKLSHEGLHIDRIAKLTKLETSAVSSILAIMEIKGVIKNIGGQNYIKI
jgi:DNA processing protein